MIKHPELLFDTQTLLESICPKTLLLVGHSIENVADEYLDKCNSILQDCEITRCAADTGLQDPIFSQRYELTIIADLLEKGVEFENKLHPEQLLSRIRNLCSPQIILTIQSELIKPNNNDLLAIGLAKYAEYQDENSSESTAYLYQYNIDTYKKTPDWFNSKNWANPELWDKYFW